MQSLLPGRPNLKRNAINYHEGCLNEEACEGFWGVCVCASLGIDEAVLGAGGSGVWEIQSVLVRRRRCGWQTWDGTRAEVLALAEVLGLEVRRIDEGDGWVDFSDGWSFACSILEDDSKGWDESQWRLCVHAVTYKEVRQR